MANKLKQLQDRQVAVQKLMRETNDAIPAPPSATASDEDRAATKAKQEELEAKFGALKTELGEVQAALAREEELQEIERAMIPTGNGSTGQAALVSGNDTVPAKAKGEEPKPWASLGQQLMAVAAAADSPASMWDNRLQQERLAAVTGLGEAVGSEGAFLVQSDFVTELMRRTYASNQVLNGGAGYSGVRRIPLSPSSNSVKINAVAETSRADGSRWGGVQAYWEGEADTATAKKPTFRQIELSLKKLLGFCYATDELLQDTTALEAVISEAFAEEFAFKIQDALINGLGSGLPLGILNSPCLINQAKESGQAATTIVKENIDKMWSRMWPQGLTNSVWLINQTCYPQLFAMTLDVGTGGMPVYLPPGGLSASPYGTLMGRPVVPIEQCQAVGTKGDIYFCDWSQYLFCDKGGMQAASSIHVRFLQGEQVFRFIYRADGQPAWASPTTPFKGGSGATTGPFISLAVRS